MSADPTFNKRVHKVVRAHDKMRLNGVVHRVGPDGLIRSRPRLIRPAFPLRGALLIVALFMAFKSILFAQMGAGNYVAQVNDLRQGSFVERAGAVLMQEDPLTRALGGYLKPYFFQR